MLSGSSWVSASMKVSAISAKVSANALAPIKLAPKWMMTHAASAPVSISMSGYRMPMGVWQFEHLPQHDVRQYRDILHCSDLVSAAWTTGRGITRSKRSSDLVPGSRASLVSWASRRSYIEASSPVHHDRQSVDYDVEETTHQHAEDERDNPRTGRLSASRPSYSVPGASAPTSCWRLMKCRLEV